eukprot:124810-Amphidinium_carterae.2
MSCLRSKVGSTRLHPPGLTLQIEGPGLVASPIRHVDGSQPNCRVLQGGWCKMPPGSLGVHR